MTVAGCLGYRTPMNEPSPGEPAPRVPREDAGADASTDRFRADVNVDAAPPDVRPDLGRDSRPDLGPDLAPDLGRDLRPDLGADLGRDLSPSDSRILADCVPGEPFVLVLAGDGSGSLYTFDPSTLDLKYLANLSCGSSRLNSLTASVLGPAYVSSASGQLCSLDLTTWQTTLTAFDPSVILRSRYGMALLPDNVPAGETLYIAANTGSLAHRLSRIDLSTFVLTDIGPIVPAVQSVELTAGPSGELYAFSIGSITSRLINIDPSTGTAIDVTEVPAGNGTPSIALVNWQGYFYLFLGNSSVPSAGAEVYRYRKGDTSATRVGTLAPTIIGAGVATCP
jgi:hypothetical protein